MPSSPCAAATSTDGLSAAGSAARLPDFHFCVALPPRAGVREICGQVPVGGACFPEFFPAATELAAPQRNDLVGAADSPAHARRLEPLADSDLTARFHNTGTYKQALPAERSVTHPFFIPFNVVHRLPDLFPHVVVTRPDLLPRVDHSFYFAGIEIRGTACRPLFCLNADRAINNFAQPGQMFPGVIEIHDLDGGTEIFGDKSPEPGCAIRQGDHLICLPQPAPQGLGKSSATCVGAMQCTAPTRRRRPRRNWRISAELKHFI
jgi:hypothetical protein